jgi:NAD(P)H-dependent FMN reductase
MKILAFGASLRKDSFNRKVIGQVDQILRGMSGIELDHADYKEFEMPIYDGDVEEESGIPAGGKEFIRRIQAADAVIISTPEYNGGIAGTLKNAIDWSSRIDPIPWDGKPVLLLGASPGGFGAVRGLWHTRVPFEAIGAFVYPEMFGVPRAHQAFDEKGAFVDAKNRARLEELIQSYLKFAAGLKSS